MHEHEHEHEHERELGAWSRARRMPHAGLAGVVVRELAREVGPAAGTPHLNRQLQQFAGTTPTDFADRLIPGGGPSGVGCAVGGR